MQRDDVAPHLLAPVGVAAVGLKPRRSLAGIAADKRRRRAQRADLAVLGCLGDAARDDLCGERGGWRVGPGSELAKLMGNGVGVTIWIRWLIVFAPVLVG